GRRRRLSSAARRGAPGPLSPAAGGGGGAGCRRRARRWLLFSQTFEAHEAVLKGFLALSGLTDGASTSPGLSDCASLNYSLRPLK
ncbi:hypothetical protein LEMLEM_LOCUS24744, partial [Lemmus lemmus]